MHEGDFGQATQEFKKVLALDPTLIEAELNLGLAYHSLGDYAPAVQHLTKALAQRPNLLPPNVIVGMDYLKLGSPQKALPYLQRALKLDPSNREAHEALASYDIGQQNFRGAADEFEQLAKINPDKSEAWFKLGHEYLDLAARLAYRGARLYPDSAWGHRFLGDLQLQSKRFDDAVQEYKKALAIDPQQSGLHTSLGQAYLQAGKVAEAEAEFHRELDIDSQNELAWMGLAEVGLKQGQANAATEALSKVWEISPEFLAQQREFPTIELSHDDAHTFVSSINGMPEDAAKHFLLSALYATEGATAQADEQWNALQEYLKSWQQHSKGRSSPCRSHAYSACIRLLQSQKSLTDAEHLTLAKAQFALRQYGDAAESFGKVRGVTKANAEASYWLSKTYQELSASVYTQLEEKFPDSWRTHQLRAESDAVRQDLDDAVKELQAAVQLRPDSPDLHEALGNVYIEKHSDEDAEKELQKALAINGLRPHALYLLGRLYVRAGENDKAIPVLQKAVQMQPDLAEASSLLGTTYVREGEFAKAIPVLEKAAQLDHYGNVHYQLYVAYRKLGQMQLAQKALARSQELRRSSLEHDQALIMGSPEPDSDPQ